MWHAPELMEHAASEVSEAYSDVFEEEMPDQSADDASDTASIRSGMTLSCSRYNQSAEDYQEDEAYTQGQWLSIGMQSMLIANIDLIVAALTQVQLRHRAETQSFTSMPTTSNITNKPGSIRSAGIRQSEM